MKNRFTTVITTIFFAFSCTASEYFVAATATGTGDGSFANPWELQQALNVPAVIGNPSDTVWIWIRGGTYTHTYDAQSSYNCKTNGTANAPIIFRNYQNERVTIDGQLPYTMSFVLGNCSYTWIWGLEFTNSSTADRDHPTGDRTGNIYCTAENIRFINLIVHDMGAGLDLWKTSKNSESYGCIIYNIGNNLNNGGNWEGHGHGMYLQNDTLGIKNIHNNIIFNSFGYGIKVWQTTTTAPIGNFDIQRNIVFNGGAASENMGGLGNNSRTHNFFVVANGVNNPITNTVIKHNYTFAGTNMPRPPVNAFGLNYGVKNMVLDSNYLTCQTRLGLNNTPIFDASVKGNHIIAGIPPEYGVYLWGFVQTDYPQNNYYPVVPTSGLEFFVLQNKYEPNRSHLVIYNWDSAAEVQITADQAGLKSGDKYELTNVMDYFNDKDTGFVQPGGLINVPMTGHSLAPVIGSKKLSVSQFPKFGVFVIRKIGTSGSGGIAEMGSKHELYIFPNPSVSSCELRFFAGVSGTYQISISNARGEVICSNKDRFYERGDQSLHIDTEDLPAGVYFVHINGNTESAIGKLLVAK